MGALMALAASARFVLVALRFIPQPSSTIGWSEARHRTGNMMMMRLSQSTLTPFNQAFRPSTSCQKG
ncbi:hypothetical protein [Bradyrhizobium sp. USDA 4471]